MPLCEVQPLGQELSPPLRLVQPSPRRRLLDRTARAELPGGQSSARPRTVSSVAKRKELSEAQRQVVWGQFVEVYSNSQKSYDNSVRTMAAAALAVTVSIGTALNGLQSDGVTAAALFLISLGLNFVSYLTAQLDMKARLNVLRTERTEGIDGNGWTVVTTALNVSAGITLIAGGVFLASFAASA